MTLTALVAVSVAFGASVSGSPTSTVTVSVGSQSGLERELEQGSVFLPVTLSAAAAEDVVVAFHTVDGTAIAGQHYVRWGTPANPRTVTIPAGQLQTTINVPLLPADGVAEDRDFSVRLVGAEGGGAVLGTTSGTARIVDSDAVAGANPALNVSSPTIVEGDEGRRRAQFQIHLSRAPGTPLTLTYSTTDGTAVAGEDYVAPLPGTVVLAAGQISRTVDVLVESDTLQNGDREFYLDVAVSGGSPVEELDVRGVATILDDDAPGDVTPPTLDLPGDISVDATSSLGAEVEWSASATDDVDGDVPVTCSPTSGSLLSVGTTEVTCEASDTSGNSATGSFAVTVGQFPTPSATAVSAGSGHTCALLDDGTVRCWGANDAGQLGDGTTADSSVAVPVVGLTDVTAISAGARHTCAVVEDTSVRCWGDNGNGRLGTGAAGGIADEPTAVGGLTDVVAVGAGGAHTCAVTSSGTVRCWGANSSGQLGDASTSGSTVPVAVSGLEDAVAVTAGNLHSCALLLDTSVRCWGSNGDGKLGTGSAGGSSPTPVEVVGASGTTTVDGGVNHSCLSTSTGTAACWGRNGAGRLGTGDEIGAATPAAVVGLDSVAGVTAGNLHSCARRDDGTVRCWGGNARGQLGTGDTTGSTTPVVSGGLTGVSDIAAGVDHTCAVIDDGSVRCWGANQSGQLGDGSTTDATSPVTVDGIGDPAPDPLVPTPMVVTGGEHSCELTDDGNVRCWGSNSDGQLGTGDTTDSLTRVDVQGLDGHVVVSLTAGNAHTCALTAQGAVLCWGDNLNGQLGTGDTTDVAVPTPVAGLPEGASTVGAGGNHTCAGLATGGARCWGWGTSGQLGQGAIGSSPVPVDVVLPAGLLVTDLSGGVQHTCASLSDGSARCWGRNHRGQLGNGSTQPSGGVPTPVQPVGLDGGVTAVALGGTSSCVLQGGIARCFGLNNAGQLGNGTTTNSNVPVQVLVLSGLTDIAVGGTSACAIDSVGAAWCWGLNQEGQLGIGDSDVNNSPVPLPVVGLGSGQSQLAAGTQHACSRSGDGTIRCWGLNQQGQLGDGTTARRFAPVLVV